MASTSTAVEGVPGGPGCHSAACVHMPLVVTIDSKENVMQSDSDAMLLQVPDQLLFAWYQKNAAASKYVPLINVVVLDNVIHLKPDS